MGEVVTPEDAATLSRFLEYFHQELASLRKGIIDSLDPRVLMLWNGTRYEGKDAVSSLICSLPPCTVRPASTDVHPLLGGPKPMLFLWSSGTIKFDGYNDQSYTMELTVEYSKMDAAVDIQMIHFRLG